MTRGSLVAGALEDVATVVRIGQVTAPLVVLGGVMWWAAARHRALRLKEIEERNMDQDLNKEIEITVAGRQYFLRRSFELARRLEAAVGALSPFAQRLERGQVTFAELSIFYAALLRGEPDAPEQKRLDAWLFETGVFGHRAVAVFTYTMLVGSEVLKREIELRNPGAGNRGGDSERGPFAPAG